MEQEGDLKCPWSVQDQEPELNIDEPCVTILGHGRGQSGFWLRSTLYELRKPDMNKPPYRVPLMGEIARLPWNGFNVVSTFSGCGGSSLGYKMAGYRVLWANEFIPEAQNTYEANHPKTILDKRDIREVQPEDILRATGLAYGEIDLFDGSPPCSSFSMAGIREDGWGKVKKYSDTEQRTDDLFFEYARLIAGTAPKTFVAENVKGLTIGAAKNVLGSDQQDMFAEKSVEETILGALERCGPGYVVGYRVLNAADLGVPQARQRCIFVGVRKDIAKEYDLKPSWPKPLTCLAQPDPKKRPDWWIQTPYQYSVRDAIPWIAKVYDGKESTMDAGANPAPTILASDGARSSSGFDQGLGYVEAETDITKYAIGKEYDNVKVGEQSDKYFQLVRPHPDKPCPTITQTAGNTGAAGVVHPYEKRKFSIAELKRICGFPDDFKLTGTFAQQWERLGRAVPPLMMMRVAHQVRVDILNKLPRGVPPEIGRPEPTIMPPKRKIPPPPIRK